MFDKPRNLKKDFRNTRNNVKHIIMVQEFKLELSLWIWRQEDGKITCWNMRISIFTPFKFKHNTFCLKKCHDEVPFELKQNGKMWYYWRYQGNRYLLTSYFLFVFGSKISTEENCNCKIIEVRINDFLESILNE